MENNNNSNNSLVFGPGSQTKMLLGSLFRVRTYCLLSVCYSLETKHHLRRAKVTLRMTTEMLGEKKVAKSTFGGWML